VRRNPSIQLYALQWGAPGWVGKDIWTEADVGYVITWLKCARQHHLRISYIGGWNEHGPGLSAGRRWVLSLRQAMDANGFASTRYVAADSFLTSASGTQLSDMMRAHPAYRRAVSVLGYHDNCHILCAGPARRFGKPVWQSELGSINTDVSNGLVLASAINRSWISAGTSAILEWPAVNAIPPDLPFQNRGLVIADWPWSGYYKITRLAWVTAQTTQFTQPGWHYARHGSRLLPAGGSVVTYEHGHDWTAVAETASAIRPQRLTLRVTRPLRFATVQVWGSDLRHSRYLIRLADRHGPAVRLTLRPGWLYTLTTTTGHRRRPDARPASAPAPAPLPYTASRDSAGLPSLLSPVQGSFSYDTSGQWFTQGADGEPVLAQLPRATWNHPYALVGDDSWADYAIGADVMFTAPAQSAGVLGRCHWPENMRPQTSGAPALSCYQLTASADGTWQLALITPAATVDVLASGSYPAPQPDTWTSVQLAMSGPVLTASVGGSQVAQVSDSSLTHGPAGITDSTWSEVGYRSLSVG
jgi:hypothetical protein